MIPSTKIPHTILKFGKALFLSLPKDHSKEELEAVIGYITPVQKRQSLLNVA
ncbi:MAG: hypothetical protein ABGX71_08940 [Methyloprofundus sp.]|uniref:hypothetical protein n=1 Tax=Methyloprofundus sp. TaxID=2020875 RepID=UPI002632B79C|nr:hypothetical protein [Methyloprofundus sp.]